MYDFSFCRLAPSSAATCMSSIDVHNGIPTAVLMAFTFIFIPVISWSLSSVSLFLESQSDSTDLSKACI